MRKTRTTFFEGGPTLSAEIGPGTFFFFKIFYAKKYTGFTTNSARLIKRCLPGNEQTNKAVKKKKKWYRSMHAVTTECRYTNGV